LVKKERLITARGGFASPDHVNWQAVVYGTSRWAPPSSDRHRSSASISRAGRHHRTPRSSPRSWMAFHLVKTDRLSESCSFGIPRMALADDRDLLIRWSQQQAARQGLGWTARSIAAKNVTSIDRLSGYAGVSRPSAAAGPVERTGRGLAHAARCGDGFTSRIWSRTASPGRPPTHVSDPRSRLCPIMAPPTNRATRGGDDGE
jgi:hypothetical protein